MKKVLLTLIVAIYATVAMPQGPNTEGGTIVTEIKPAALPKCVLDYIKFNLKDHTIGKAYKVEKTYLGKVTYTGYVVSFVKANDKGVYFSFDKDCRSPKKISKSEFDSYASKVKISTAKPKEDQPASETGGVPKK